MPLTRGRFMAICIEIGSFIFERNRFGIWVRPLGDTAPCHGVTILESTFQGNISIADSMPLQPIMNCLKVIELQS